MQKFINFDIDTTFDNTITNEYAIFKGDTLTLTIRVFNKGALVDLTNQIVDLVLLKADGNPVEGVQKAISNGIITAELTQQATLCEGIVRGTLQIVENSTSHISTNEFTYLVLPSISETVLEASRAEINTLSDLLIAIKNNNDILTNYQTVINQVAGTTDSVQALAKIESDITTYLPALQSANTQAIQNISDETVQNTQATQNINNLTTKNSEATQNISGLDTKNNTASSNISALDTKNSAASQNISDLNSKNSTASSNISLLDGENAEATTNIANLGSANTRAEDNIAALNSFGDATQLAQDVAAVKSEVEGARGTYTDLKARLDASDTSLGEKAKQTDLEAIAVYNATCTYASNVFTLTLANAPATLPSMYTLRVKMTNDWVDSSTIKIGSKTYTISNAAFVNGDIVTINFDEVNSKAFFKSGGGILDTLPAQVSTFTVTPGDTVLNFAWNISDSSYLSGFYLVYKQGSAPANINDGAKIDITNPAATSQQVTGVTNGLSYTGRIFPYNSKKQAQTQYKVATATPVAGQSVSNLAVGSKLTINGYNFIVADKNHTGFPSNSVTLLLETPISSKQFDAGKTSYTDSNQKTYGSNRFSVSDIKAWLNSTFIGYLTGLGSNILDTTITTVKNNVADGGGSETTTCKAFLPSTTELGLANENSIAEGNKIAYFNSNAIFISGIYQWLRTPLYTQSAYVHFIDGGGSLGSDYANVSKSIRPVLNINNSTKVSPAANGSGYYTLM